MPQTAAEAHRPVSTVRAAGAAALADRDLHPVLGMLRQVRPKCGGLVQVLRHVGGVRAAWPRWDLPRRHDDLPCSHEADADRSYADQVASSLSGGVTATSFCFTGWAAHMQNGLKCSCIDTRSGTVSEVATGLVTSVSRQGRCSSIVIWTHRPA